ncbi:hypothetical protein DTO169E5_1595 [Paecilomyces variotii]|nr:hypothetical protein DTO169E5_1595 [Paecilomyces variotii]
MKPLPFPYSLNIGTDIVHLPRILRLITSATKEGSSKLDRFTRRILCEQEQRDFRSRFRLSTAPGVGPCLSTVTPTPDMARWLAGRFAAKEAARKASTRGAGAIGWKDVLVSVEDTGTLGSGRPQVIYLDAKTEGNARIGKLSISHDGEYVVATVLAAE